MAFHPSVRIFDHNDHEQLVRRGLLYEMLAGLDRLHLVGSRPLADRFSAIFGYEVFQHTIPEEQNFARPGSGQSDHYPDRYNELHRRINPPRQGDVYLVGGGPCGKVYCNLIKERGGIAIDMGAMFDCWAGLVTRLYFDRANARIEDKGVDEDLLLTSGAVFRTTGGKVDPKSGALPSPVVKSRIVMAAKRQAEILDAREVEAQNRELWERVRCAEAALRRAERENGELWKRVAIAETSLEASESERGEL